MYPLDLLLQYLKQVDEVQLLELLDITSEDLLKAFKSKVISRRLILEKEVEMMPISDEEVDEEDYGDDLDEPEELNFDD